MNGDIIHQIRKVSGQIKVINKNMRIQYNGIIRRCQRLDSSSILDIRSRLNTIMNPLDIIICIFDKINRLTSHKPRHYVHCRDRRKSPVYLKKQKIVKNVWSIALILFLIMLQFDHIFLLALIIVISIFITFISFAILDETK